MVYLGPTALFSTYKLTTISGKHLQDISHTHILSPMYKLITSARDTDELSIGFDRDRNRRQQESTKNKITKGKFHVRIMLKDVFGFAEHQKEATYGLGRKLSLTRTVDNSVLNKDNATNNAKIKINGLE